MQATLLDLIRHVDFGSIEDLVVVDGEPVLDPRPRIIRVIKLREFASAEPRDIPADYILKIQVIQLLACLQEIGSGMIQRIEIQAGLPFKVVIEETGDPMADRGWNRSEGGYDD